MFKRADERTVCRERPIVILIWERAKRSIGLFLTFSSWWALDWSGSATNRLLKPPNHAAISHAFEAVQCSAINRLFVVQHWRHPVLGRHPCASQSRAVVGQNQDGQCVLRLCCTCPAFLGWWSV